jgi:hypothetical protein
MKVCCQTWWILSVTAKDYKYSLLYGLTNDPRFSTFLQNYFSSKTSQPVTYEDLKRELINWAITKDRLNAHTTVDQFPLKVFISYGLSSLA